MNKITASQARATASFHDRMAAAQARFGVRPDHQLRHKQDAEKLRKRADIVECYEDDGIINCAWCGQEDINWEDSADGPICMQCAAEDTGDN